jgi:hypothetical protein
MTVMTTERATAAPVAYAPPRRADALSLTEMSPADVWRFCEKLADSPLLPDAYRRNPSSVLWAMEYGRALGLDVVTTISTIHVIKGKPSQSADLMLSRTRAAGHRVRIQPGDGSCTASIWRSDDPEFENRVTWTYDDAVRAQLCTMRDTGPYSRSSKGEPQSWEKWPRAMLRARAISEALALRKAYPLDLAGVYTAEEMAQADNPEPAPSFSGRLRSRISGSRRRPRRPRRCSSAAEAAPESSRDAGRARLPARGARRRRPGHGPAHLRRRQGRGCGARVPGADRASRHDQAAGGAGPYAEHGRIWHDGRACDGTCHGIPHP